MEQIVKILDTWSGTANQLRMRDRSVKVLQYGCQMLLGFYGKKFSNEMQQALALFRRTASTSRKAFWLLKSVNHITNAIHMAQKIMFEFSWVLFFDLMEQVFLALYYVMENIVFFIRVKMISWSEDDVDFGVNWTWFIGDFFCVAAALLRFCESCYNCQNMNFATNQESLQKYQKLYFDLVGLMIATFEVIVSADYVDGFKAIFGQSIGNGYVGLCGVLSSLLILGDGAVKTWISLSERK